MIQFRKIFLLPKSEMALSGQNMTYCQSNDLTVDGAMTDPKGDRGLPPHAQQDPDLYLHG